MGRPSRTRSSGAAPRWLHVVDLDGARDPRARQTDLVAAIVARVGERARVEVAGGLRDERAVDACLRAGADRIVVGTAALRDPAFAGRLVERFGAGRIAVALDVREGMAVGQGWVRGTEGVAVADALERLADEGVGIFEATAIDRDGTLDGPDLAMLGGARETGTGRTHRVRGRRERRRHHGRSGAGVRGRDRWPRALRGPRHPRRRAGSGRLTPGAGRASHAGRRQCALDSCSLRCASITLSPICAGTSS